MSAIQSAFGSGSPLDTSAADIQPFGTQAAGSTSKGADAGHVHPDAGKAYAFTLNRYAP